jgi:hypothetical protein
MPDFVQVFADKIPHTHGAPVLPGAAVAARQPAAVAG